MIKDARQLLGSRSLRHWLDSSRSARKLQLMRGFMPMPIEEGNILTDPVLEARIEYGRWIVDCPGSSCQGAEALWKVERLFFCWSCGNKEMAGRWLRVVLPENYEEIEAAVLERQEIAHQHWFPYETAEDVRSETAIMQGGSS